MSNEIGVANTTIREHNMFGIHVQATNATAMRMHASYKDLRDFFAARGTNVAMRGGLVLRATKDTKNAKLFLQEFGGCATNECAEMLMAIAVDARNDATLNVRDEGLDELDAAIHAAFSVSPVITPKPREPRKLDITERIADQAARATEANFFDTREVVLELGYRRNDLMSQSEFDEAVWRVTQIMRAAIREKVVGKFSIVEF